MFCSYFLNSSITRTSRFKLVRSEVRAIQCYGNKFFKICNQNRRRLCVVIVSVYVFIYYFFSFQRNSTDSFIPVLLARYAVQFNVFSLWIFLGKKIPNPINRQSVHSSRRYTRTMNWHVQFIRRSQRKSDRNYNT